MDQFGNDMPKLIAVLNQRPYLFDTTVANNIRLGKPEATDEEIRNVAKQVKLDRLIESLPLGLSYPDAGNRGPFLRRGTAADRMGPHLLQDTPRDYLV